MINLAYPLEENANASDERERERDGQGCLCFTITHETTCKQSLDFFNDFFKGHADPMDFWDHTLWWLIPQNNGNASEPVFTTPHLIHYVQPNIKLILLLREPAERWEPATFVEWHHIKTFDWFDSSVQKYGTQCDLWL